MSEGGDSALELAAQQAVNTVNVQTDDFTRWKARIVEQWKLVLIAVAILAVVLFFWLMSERRFRVEHQQLRRGAIPFCVGEC